MQYEHVVYIRPTCAQKLLQKLWQVFLSIILANQVFSLIAKHDQSQEYGNLFMQILQGITWLNEM